MKLRPRRKGVIIKPDEKPLEEKTAGGIIIPQEQWSMHADVIFGTVDAVGEDCKELKKDMRVIVGRFAGVSLGDDRMLVDDADIIAEVME